MTSLIDAMRYEDPKIDELQNENTKLKEELIKECNEHQEFCKIAKNKVNILDEALYWACQYITQLVDKDVNTLAHEWAKHFIGKAEELKNDN